MSRRIKVKRPPSARRLSLRLDLEAEGEGEIVLLWDIVYVGRSVYPRSSRYRCEAKDRWGVIRLIGQVAEQPGG